MTENSAWTQEWLKAQQKFVESWSDMAKGWRQSDNNEQTRLWANGLEMWRKTYPFPYPAQTESEQVINKCMDIGKGYFAMAEQIGKQVAAGGKPDQVIHQWLEQLKTSLQQQADHWAPMQHQAAGDFISQWMGPSASWQKLAMSMMPFQTQATEHSGWGIGEDYQQLNQLLSMPGVGFYREAQEKQQKGVKLLMDYQQANNKFNQSLLRVAIESLQQFQQKLSALNESDEAQAPSSLRGLYDLWVDVSEAVYADYAMSAEYQSLYGDMVNRLMEMKKHYGAMMDETMGRLNLPTRKELDTVQQRLQETRRENRALRREINEIRQMLGKKAAPAKKAAARKTQVKKSTAKQSADEKTSTEPKAGA